MTKNKQLIAWFLIPLIICMCVSGLVALQIDRDNHRAIQEAVQQETLRIADEMVARINLYQYGLRGARGAVLTAGETTISRELFRRYSQTRDIDKEFPGAHGFGFIRRVTPEQEADFLANARLDGKPDFAIRQLTPHSGDRYVIQYIEPVERNALAIGLDTASEAHRREAAETSMRSGAVAITAPITLVQATGNPSQSFLIFLPIYSTAVTPETLAERERELVGWSYAPLLMKEVLGTLSVNIETTKFALSDITNPSARTEFFSSKTHTSPPLMSQTIERDVMGRRWQIELGIYPSFIQRLHLVSAKLTFLIGLVFSLLVAALAGTLGLSQYRKREVVVEQARLAAIVASSIDGIIGNDLTGTVTSWNHGAELIFGYKAQEAIGKRLANLVVPQALQHEETDILARIANGEAVSHFTTIRQRRDGSKVPVSVVVAPIRNTRGEVIGAAKTIRDITEQKAAEDKILDMNLNLEVQVTQRTAQLELARRSLQTVLDAVPSMIGYWDKQLINRVANRAYQDWFGLDREAIPGMHARELFGAELFESNRELMEAALRGEKKTFNRTISTPTGKKHALTHYLPDIDNGEVQGFYDIVHDITEVTEANSHLMHLVRENRALLNTINQQFMYSVTDMRGNIIDINNNFLEASGYSQAEVLGQNHRLLNAGVHSSEFWHELWKTISAGKSWHGEICNRSKSGNLMWFDSVIAPVLGVDGKVERYIALRTDITERKWAEDERAKLNLLITNVLNAATEIAIIATDIEGTVTIFNRGAELMLGYSSEELVNKTSPAIFHVMDEVIARGKELTHEFGMPIEGFRAFVHKSEFEGAETRTWTYVRKDGSQLQVTLAVTTLRDAEGNITGYLGMATDVTEDLQNKRILKSTIDQFTIASDVAELGVWSWTFANNSFEWNDRMFDIYSLPKSLRETGLTPEHWKARLHPDDVDLAISALKTAIEHGGVYDVTFRVLKPDNTIHYVQAKAEIERDHAGVPIKATGVNRDITSQMELESWLRQAKENADAASASKSAFLANMSHEIRTPMNAVLGMLQLVQQTELTQRQQDYIAKSQTAAKSLLGLLNDILDFSKIDSGKLQLDSHPFELEPLMRDLAVILSANQAGKNVEIIFDIDTALPQNLVGDRLRLQQILINLAGNALKFTNHGQVLVKLQLLEKNGQDIGVHMEVSDTGIGISAEQIARIFEGFVQAEASTTRRFGGTGLGLVISKRLVGLMGGELHVESKVGQGSRFWFDIALKAEEPRQAAARSIPLTIAGLHVLVVDDNAVSREVLVRTVTALGAQADEADGGLTAIEKIRTVGASHPPYDLVLMDWRMPDLDGLSAAELIRNTPNNTNAPIVIMVTAFGREDIMDAHTSKIAPYSDLLTKPVTPEQLTESITRAMAGNTLNPLQIIPRNARQQPLAGLHLLVVEDNALNRQVASELLASEGAIVELAEGGLEGVSKVLDKHHAFDVVIMDIQMPDIDGMEATRRIRALADFKTLPILAMTANVSAADKAACLAAGMNDHVGKPIDMEEVVPCILALLGKPVAQKPQDNKPSSGGVEGRLTEDLTIVLKRFSGKVDLYARMLESFHPHTAKMLEKLNFQNQPTNSANIAAELHSIKGIAGTMGAKALAAKASELEQAFKSSNLALEPKLLTQETLNELQHLLDKSAAQLTQSLRDFEAVIPVEKSEAPTLLSPEEWKKALTEILPVLEADNLSAGDMLEKLYSASHPHEQILLSKLVSEVNELQYGLAVTTIKQLLAAN
jgi:PAS domain S-box-containing protein